MQPNKSQYLKTNKQTKMKKTEQIHKKKLFEKRVATSVGAKCQQNHEHTTHLLLPGRSFQSLEAFNMNAFLPNGLRVNAT